MPSVTYRVEGDVAVIEVNNPPVNALSKHVRVGIVENTLRARADPKVRSIVLIGQRVFLGGADIKEFADGNSRTDCYGFSSHVREGIWKALEDGNKDARITSMVLIGRNAFLGGADITEFKDGSFYNWPTLHDAGEALESSPKPVVAAISGFALGGGFEVALCCHYRVAVDNAKFGFPEVDIGILPAAMGTQRFPRVVGLKAALDIIPTGRRISAKEAHAIGAVDKVVKGNLLQEALTYARSVAKRPLDDRRTSKMVVKDASRAIELRDAAVRKANMKMKGMLSPLFCIKSVMASVDLPYEQGIAKEAEYATVLFSSSQARALQYAFFSERAAVKWDIPGLGNFKTIKPQPIKTGAVIGAGTMGSGIAMAMMNAGIPVTLMEQNQKFLEKGVALLKSLYEGSVRVKKLTVAQAKAAMGLLKTSVDYKDLRDVDIVVEAVFERMDVKQAVFKELDRHCKPSALLCTNTSALDIDLIAQVTSRPEQVVGVHFFVPAYHMRLLENVRGAKTSAHAIATAQAFGARLGKVPIVVGNCDGFAANRMRGPQAVEAVFLLEEGCVPDQVDRVMEDFGLALGTLKVNDLSGLDIGVSSRKERMKQLGLTLEPGARHIKGVRISTLGDMMVEQGRLGRKTGKGFYAYEKPHAKQPYNDTKVLDLLVQHSKNIGLERRRISDQEILERLLYSSINEGFKIMEEGISTRPEEIDTIWLLGFGWPRYLGGPMYYANMVGLERIYERVCYYFDKHPTSPHWQPSELLKTLATNNVPFKQWSQHVRRVPSNL